MKKELMTSALIAGTLGLAPSANAVNVMITLEDTYTGMTVLGNSFTGTASHVDGTELIMTVVGSSTFAGETGDLKWQTGRGVTVKGGNGGSNKNNLIGYKSLTAGSDQGAIETLAISFDQDVIFNFGGETGSFTTGKATGNERIRIVSSEGGTDEGKDTNDFSNITTLAAGGTLTVSFFDTGGPNSSASGTLKSFSVYTASTAVPEPSTTALLGLGGLALILRRRK